MLPNSVTCLAVPGAPKDGTIEILNITAVSLSWNRPDKPNGIVLDYQVIYYGTNVGSEVHNYDSINSITCISSQFCVFPHYSDLYLAGFSAHRLTVILVYITLRN